ncbi:MAG: hypothetical protein RLZZ40_577 [Actinomycetota bacterium]
MKHSEFARAVDAEFGAAAGQALVRDLVLTEFGVTSAEALAAGTKPRDVWAALCKAMDVPVSRVHGAGLIDPKD